jgi:hypothetical protein
MSIVQPFLTSENIIDITEYVNKYRSKHQADPLEWDTIIANFTQNWSYYMTSNHVFKHSGSSLYGENIAYFRGYGSDVMVLIKLAIDNWYNEVTLYNFNKPGYSEATGHFTCLVWQASKMFGMGISINNSTNEVYISFNTSPRGNIIGQFQQNVLPSSFIPIPIPIPPVPVPVPIPPVPVPIPPVHVPPIHTNNKLSVIFKLQQLINQVNSGYAKYYIISDIHKIINKIQNSSPF